MMDERKRALCGAAAGAAVVVIASLALKSHARAAASRRAAAAAANRRSDATPAHPPRPAPVHPEPAAQGQARKSVTVRVPATTANLGSGYDVIGMALDMWSEVTVELADEIDEEVSVSCEGEGGDVLGDLLVVAVQRGFEMANVALPVLRYSCVNRIPYARGLGSSSAIVVGGLIAGMVMAGHQVQVGRSQDSMHAYDLPRRRALALSLSLSLPTTLPLPLPLCS